jgi:hypothetical protein
MPEMTNAEYIEFQRMSKSWTNSPNLVKKCAGIWLHYLIAQVLLGATIFILYLGMMFLAAMITAMMK